jgi:hypothetical protein
VQRFDDLRFDSALGAERVGHPAPIFVRPDRSITFLEGRGLVLGVEAQTPFEDLTKEMGEGCALVLYTDCLMETDRDYLSGLTTLGAAVLAEYNESSRNIADNIQRRIFAHTAVELIYGELLANVARHTPGMATVTLEWNGKVPVLHVDDQGPPFQPAFKPPNDGLSEFGRGFLLISHFAPDVVVGRMGDANRVTVSLPLAGVA